MAEPDGDPKPLPPTGKRVEALEAKIAELETRLATATTDKAALEAELRKLQDAVNELTKKPASPPAKEAADAWFWKKKK